MAMDADTPRFTLRQASELTGWHLGSLRDYFVKGVFQWHAGEGKSGQAGLPNLLSLRGVVRLAIAFQLWKLGVPVKLTEKSASIFSDFGNSRTSNSYNISRVSGNLYPDGYLTILLWKFDNNIKIIPVLAGEGLPISELTCKDCGRMAIVIVVDDIINDIMSKIDFDQI